MLDTTLFSVNLPEKEISKNKTLILCGCETRITPCIDVYSELDELNYYTLNNNDYGLSRLDIQLDFQNNFEDPYFNFYVQCVSLRTNKGLLRKINYNPFHKALRQNYYSKITKEGYMAIGISFYFEDSEQIQKLLNCDMFCMEGFIALKKKSNMYGVM